MTKREFLDIVFALVPNEANKIMDAFDEYVESNEPHWIPLTHRTFDEQIANFNRVVSSWDINQEYKVALLGMIASLGYEYEKSITPEPHWIPVTERLSEIRHDVLFTVFFHETWRTMQGYRQDGEFMFWYNGRLESALDDEHRVSAWMPLPEPYKGVTT